MERKYIATALLALTGVSVMSISVHAYVKLKTAEFSKTELTELGDVAKWKLFLYEESLRRGLNYEEFRLLRSIVQCESSWRQFYKDGTVIISSGNIGLAQINRFAHEKTYTKLNIDPSDPYDNLRFMVFLYQRDGVAPWLKWSGHCWYKRSSISNE